MVPVFFLKWRINWQVLTCLHNTIKTEHLLVVRYLSWLHSVNCVSQRNNNDDVSKTNKQTQFICFWKTQAGLSHQVSMQTQRKKIGRPVHAFTYQKLHKCHCSLTKKHSHIMQSQMAHEYRPLFFGKTKTNTQGETITGHCQCNLPSKTVYRHQDREGKPRWRQRGIRQKLWRVEPS